MMGNASPARCMPLPRRAGPQPKLRGIMAKTARCVECGNFFDSGGEFGFVCAMCGCVNRKNEVRKLETSEVCEVTLLRTGPCLYLAEKDSDCELGGLAKKFPVVLGHCDLCMDALGDCVLLSCGHGGVCERCATSLLTLSSTSNQCPVCRAEIAAILRILALYEDCAKTVQVKCVSARPAQGQAPSVPTLSRKKKANL